MVTVRLRTSMVITMITSVMEELKTLDESEILFVSGFEEQFEKQLVGISMALEVLRDFNLPKESLNCWKESELLGQLMGKTAYLYIKYGDYYRTIKEE